MNTGNDETLTDRDKAFKFVMLIRNAIAAGFKVWYTYLDAPEDKPDESKEVQIGEVRYEDDYDFIMIYPTQEYRDSGFHCAGLAYNGGHSIRIEYPYEGEVNG